MKTLSCRGQPGDDRERRVFEADAQRRSGGVARRWVVARAVDRRVRPSIYAAKRGGCNRVMTRAELAGGGEEAANGNGPSGLARTDPSARPEPERVLSSRHEIYDSRSHRLHGGR